MKADEQRGDSPGDSIEGRPLCWNNARMKAGHGQIAPNRMKYLLFQGEEYLRTLGSLWRRINNVIIE